MCGSIYYFYGIFDPKNTINLFFQGGRFVAITFHSLEDAIVKRVFSGVDVNKPMGMSILQQVGVQLYDHFLGNEFTLNKR